MAHGVIEARPIGSTADEARKNENTSNPEQMAAPTAPLVMAQSDQLQRAPA
jgi:hypothetical protein